MTASTADRFLDGRITVRQPSQGFRSGLDAVMLAAAVPAEAEGEILELGAGSGVASLCVAARVPACSIVGVEIDGSLVKLANENAKANDMDTRVRFLEGDALSPQSSVKREFSHVFSNPPFHGDDGMASPVEARHRALHDEGAFAAWLEAGMKRTASGGTFTVIIRADRLGDALATMPGKGAIVFPLWPREAEPSKRVILCWRKGSAAALTILPGLVLHEADGRYSAAADAVLRSGASLALHRPQR